MSKLYIPLRSNAGWFSGPDTQLLLERRLKAAILCYDEVVLQDGRYEAFATDSGRMDGFIAPHALKDRDKIEFYEPGVHASLSVASSPNGPFYPVVAGTTSCCYHVDFYPLLRAARLQDAKYIKWSHLDLTQVGVEKAKRRTEADLRHPDYERVFGERSYAHELAVLGFHRDLMVANAEEAPMLIDSRVAPLIDWRNSLSVKAAKLHPSAESLVHAAALDLEMPDYTKMSWEQVHTLRESPIGRDYRAMLVRVSARLAQALPECNNAADAKYVALKEFSKELKGELKAHLPTGVGTILSVVQNFLDLGSLGAVGTVQDLRELQKHKRSWVVMFTGEYSQLLNSSLLPKR